MSKYVPMDRSGRSENDVRKQIKNQQARLRSVGETPPAYDAKKGFSMLGRGVMKGIEALNKPLEATKMGIKSYAQKKPVLEGMKKGWTGEERYSGNQVMKDLGVDNKLGRGLGGFAVDVAIDPLNFVTGGVGAFGKGLATGKKATISAKGLEAATNARGYKALDTARTSLIRENRASTFKDLLHKMGKSEEEVNDLIKRRAFGATEADKYTSGLELQQRFNKNARNAAQRFADVKAGKGFTVAGKTIASGRAMQDAGAAVSDAVTKLPYIGDAVTSARGKLGAGFKSHYVKGMDSSEQDVLDYLINAQKGTQNALDARTTANLKNLGILQKNATIGGRAIDDEIGNIISTGGQGVSEADLRTVIATTPQQREAAKALGMAENATFGDVLDYYKKSLRNMGKEEMRSGVLTNLKSDYFPRVLHHALENAPRKGGMTRNFNVNNAFNIKRDEKYAGKSISEINDAIREGRKAADIKISDDFKLLEESALRAFTKRALTHNKLLADRQSVDAMLKTFGKKVSTKNDVRRLMNEGYDIVVPQTEMNLINVSSIPKGEAMGLGNKAAEKVVKRSVENNPELLQALSMSDALNFVGDIKNTKMYALPQGMARTFSKTAQSQLDEGVESLHSLIDSFHNVWKPLVTALNTSFHTRNLKSATFNNFLDLGKDMFDPKTQAMATAVAGRKGLGKTSKIKIKIGSKTYTADEIYDMMLENNALSAFNTNEATNIAGGAAKDVAEVTYGRNAWQAVNHLGRGAGNRVEEYARAVNFIGHLKQGLSPADAAEMVRRYHFDYTDLSVLEKQMKRVLPFYTWLRKNAPLQLESFLNDHRVYTSVDKLNRNMAEASDFDYSTLPNYMQEGMVTPTGRTADGRVRVYDAGLPAADLYTGINDALGLVSPLIKAPLEVGFNKSALTGGPLYSEGEAAAKLTKTGTSPIDRLIQHSPEYFKNYLTEHPKLAEGIDYGIRQTGVFNKLNNYGADNLDSSNSKTVQKGYERLDSSTPAKQMVNMLRGQFDPTMTSLKYVDPEKAQTNQDWAHSRQLAKVIKQLKAQGTEVPTMTELKKRRY